MQGLPQNRPGAPVGRDIQAAMDRSGADNRRSHLGVTLAIFSILSKRFNSKTKEFLQDPCKIGKCKNGTRCAYLF